MSTPSPQDLHKAALAVLNHSYCAYSGFKVASAVATEQGKIFAGVNVENASYGATMCAERSAIFSAVSSGAKNLTDVLVMTDQKDPWPPCGLCRQVILEFATTSTKVHLANLQGVQKTLAFSELLPLAFTKDQLK